MPAGFEGSGSYFGYGYETSRGIPGATIDQYMQFQKESLRPKYDKKPNPNINWRRMAQKSRLLSVALGGAISGAPDAESQARLRAHHQGKCVTTELMAATAYEHVLSPLLPSDPAEAIYRETVHGVIYRDDAVPMRMYGGKVSDVTITADEFAYVSMEHALQFEHYCELGDPVVVQANPGFTGTVYVRGVARASWAAAAEVYFKCETAGALDGTAEIITKMGLAGVYGATKYAVVANQWITINDEADQPLGPDYWQPVQICFVPGAPGETLTKGATPDEWKIARTRTVDAPTYTSRQIYDASQITMTIGGVSKVLRGVTIKGTKPRAPWGGLGSKFVQRLADSGEISWVVTLNRKYQDRDFIDAVRAGTSAEVSFSAVGDVLGGGYRDSHTIVLADCQYDDAGSEVASAAALEEQVVLSAFDNGVDPICVETIVNSIAAL